MRSKDLVITGMGELEVLPHPTLQNVGWRKKPMDIINIGKALGSSFSLHPLWVSSMNVNVRCSDSKSENIRQGKQVMANGYASEHSSWCHTSVIII